MKKVSIGVLVLVLMMTLIVTAFARPTCPVCNNGGLISTSYSAWKDVRGGAYIHWAADHWDGPYWKERTVTVKCTKGTHTYTETKDRGVAHNINVALWGYTR